MSSTQPALEPRSNLAMHLEVLAWFDENQRDLPWRKSTAWGVMVSEFMLQQTPVNRVLPIWNDWMNRWPTPKDLSSAKKSDLLKAWGRLGYPRRALRLHEAATIIATQYNNQVPTTEAELRNLPGVGEYTAAAIMAFAHKEKSLVLDVNIRRLFARVLDGQEFPPLHITNTERQARTELIPKEASTWAAARWNLAHLFVPPLNQCVRSVPSQTNVYGALWVTRNQKIKRNPPRNGMAPIANAAAPSSNI